MSNNEGSAFFSIAIMIIISLAYWWFASISCSNTWEHSGLKSKWGMTTGCMVKVPSGVWLPATSIREVDIVPKKEEAK